MQLKRHSAKQKPIWWHFNRRITRGTGFQFINVLTFLRNLYRKQKETERNEIIKEIDCRYYRNLNSHILLFPHSQHRLQPGTPDISFGRPFDDSNNNNKFPQQVELWCAGSIQGIVKLRVSALESDKHNLQLISGEIEELKIYFQSWME